LSSTVFRVCEDFAACDGHVEAEDIVLLSETVSSVCEIQAEAEEKIGYRS
jgi:hypothetical protein